MIYLIKRDKEIKDRVINDCHKYTIAYIEEISNGRKSKKYVDYYFVIDGKKHTLWESFGFETRDRYNIKEGGRFFVKFCPDDPAKYHILFYDKPVPDSIKSAPPLGFDKRPFYIYTDDIFGPFKGKY